MESEKLQSIEEKLDLLIQLFSKHPLFEEHFATLYVDKEVAALRKKLEAQNVTWLRQVSEFCVETMNRFSERISYQNFDKTLMGLTVKIVPVRHAPRYAVEFINQLQTLMDLQGITVITDSLWPGILADVLKTCPNFEAYMFEYFGAKVNVEEEILKFKNSQIPASLEETIITVSSKHLLKDIISQDNLSAPVAIGPKNSYPTGPEEHALIIPDLTREGVDRLYPILCKLLQVPQ